VANYRLGKVPAAEQALRKSLDQSSNKYLEGLFLLAQLLNDQQRFADAEPCARQAIVVDEASWHGHFELARSLVGLKRGPEAEASAIRARDLKPDNPQVFLVLANVHLQGRDYPAVVQDFNAYLKLDPSSPASEGIRNRRDQLQKAIQNAQAQSVKP
jgi:tetratricopeptide (TPR) repeat protein